MKISQLIQELLEIQKEHPDAEVIMQKDAEGNGYSPLSGTDLGIYISESTWSGEVYDPSWSADDAAMDKEDWGELLETPRAVILYPIN